MHIDIWWDEKEESTKFTLLNDIEVNGFVIPAGFCSDGCSCPKQLWGYCEALNRSFHGSLDFA